MQRQEASCGGYRILFRGIQVRKCTRSASENFVCHAHMPQTTPILSDFEEHALCSLFVRHLDLSTLKVPYVSVLPRPFQHSVPHAFNSLISLIW